MAPELAYRTTGWETPPTAAQFPRRGIPIGSQSRSLGISRNAEPSRLCHAQSSSNYLRDKYPVPDLFPRAPAPARKSVTMSPSSEAIRLPFKQVCIVGGGNAAHALAALLPSRGFRTVWYAPFEDEAKRINSQLARYKTISATFAPHNTPNGEVQGRPLIVSADAQDVIPSSDVLLLPVPSFAYSPLLRQMKDHLRPGTFVGVTPGQGGFDWIAQEILGSTLFSQITVFAILPMPFNCRTTEFGHSVAVQTYKRHYRIGVVPEVRKEEALAINRALFGHTEFIGHFINCTLYPINAIIHPQRLYRLCKDWTPDGPPLKENPFFYEHMDEESTSYMDQVNKELIEVCERLTALGMEAKVPHIFEFLSWVYPEVKAKNLVEIFASNDAYKGFRCPFKRVDGGWVPDFENRYFTEDIPCGLCIYKGVADIVNVPTPMMDRVLTWAQEHMGKEYLVEGRLQGKDVGETTAPQRFGITTVAQLKKGTGMTL